MTRGPETFTKVANVTLSAAGYGFCTITCPSGVKWRITSSTLSTNVGFRSTTTQPPSAVVYRDSAPNVSKMVEGTNSGNGSSSDTVYDLVGGDALTAEWTGGTAGSIATYTVRGMQIQTGV
jgi:hypothetical protein